MNEIRGRAVCTNATHNHQTLESAGDCGEPIAPKTEQQRFEVLVSEYGDARHKTVDAIHEHKEWRPEYARGSALYDEIADRVAKLRRLAHDELARGDQAAGISATEVLRLLDGTPAADEPRCGSCGEPWRLIRSGAVGHCGDERGNDCPEEK